MYTIEMALAHMRAMQQEASRSRVRKAAVAARHQAGEGGGVLRLPFRGKKR